MKINEVEAQVGITKKNIRFYEEQGLLSPRRDSANGYRDYGPEEVAVLRQIKLLRKLGVPLEEIRRMQSGGTVADGMRRHLVTLERERRNLEQSMELCRSLKDREERLDSLDAAALLEDMERMEREGATFLNQQLRDRKPIRYAAPVAIAALMTALMAGLMALMAWGFAVDPAEAPPMPLLALLVASTGVVILGVLWALVQRIREIQRGKPTMQKNIEKRRVRRRREAVRGVLIFALLQALTAGLAGWVCFLPDVPRWCAVLCGVVAVGSLLLLLPAVVVLKARFQEIEGGELDAAAEY